MKLDEIYHMISEFNEDEHFYKRYYEAKQDPDSLDSFLRDLDVDKVKQRKLIVPEAHTGYDPSAMKDETYFQISDINNIVVNKHNRYTPEFKHTHVFFELVYVLSGQCRQTVEEENVNLTEGCFCLLAPGAEHSIGVFDSSLVINILIRRSTFEDIFYEMLRDDNKISLFFTQNLYAKRQRTYLVFDTKKDPLLKEMVLNMFGEYTEKKKYYDKILNSLLMVLFSKMLQLYEYNIRYPKATRKKDEVCTVMLSYIEKFYQRVSLREVAERFNYSTAYCSRFIKEYTGHSFTEILQDIKFRKALSLLESTNISIADISGMVGFENVEHFNRLFKKRYHMTPGAYRKKSN